MNRNMEEDALTGAFWDGRIDDDVHVIVHAVMDCAERSADTELQDTARALAPVIQDFVRSAAARALTIDEWQALHPACTSQFTLTCVRDAFARTRLGVDEIMPWSRVAQRLKKSMSATLDKQGS
jgi:hypothetical protein